MSGCSDSRSVPNQAESYQLQFIEPLLPEGFAVWPLKSRTVVGFTSDCDILLPLSHVSRDLKLSRRDSFVISFDGNARKWILSAGDGANRLGRGTFAEDNPMSVSYLLDESPRHHMQLQDTRGRFIFKLPSRNTDFRWDERGSLRFCIEEASKVEEPRSYLDKLPSLVLGRVASYLSQNDLFNRLIPAYPAVAGRIRHAVTWSSIGLKNDFLPIDLLEAIRCLMLVSAESLVSFTVLWKPKDEETSGKWKRLLTSPHLRRVRVLDLRVLLQEKVSDAVRAMTIVVPEPLNGKVLWTMFEKNLLVPANLEMLEVEAEAYDKTKFPMSLSDGGAAFHALFSDVPSLHFLTNPRPQFWKGFPSFDNIREASFVAYRWLEGVAPLERFPNLRTLQLDMWPVRGGSVVNFDVFLPRLETLELANVSRNEFCGQRTMWAHFSRLFPNVTTIKILVCAESSRNLPADVFEITIPESFISLQKLRVLQAPLHLNVVKNMIDRFEALRPGQIKEVSIDGVIKYVGRKSHVVCAGFARWFKRKKRDGRFGVYFKWYTGDLCDDEDRTMWDLVPHTESPYEFKFTQP